jgi:hypothetical protein
VRGHAALFARGDAERLWLGLGSVLSIGALVGIIFFIESRRRRGDQAYESVVTRGGLDLWMPVAIIVTIVGLVTSWVLSR